MSHPGGRPTLYSEEMCVKSQQYISSCQDTYASDKHLTVKIPSIGGLAANLGVSRDTLYEWQKEHEEFSYIIANLLSEQEQRLINKGLAGEYNPTIAKVLLAKHGYSEKQEIQHSGDAEHPLSVLLVKPEKRSDESE